MLTISYLPSHTYHLILTQSAEKAIQFYQNMRGKNADYELLQQEINKLKNTVGDANSEKSNEKSFDWSELVNAPGKKAMIIGIVLALLNQLCGKKDLNR